MVTNSAKPCILPLTCFQEGKGDLRVPQQNGILRNTSSLKQGFSFEFEIHRFGGGKLQTIIRQIPGLPGNNDIKTYFFFNIIARKRSDNLMTLLERIHKLAQNNNLSKHEQLVQGVIEAIDMELLKVGDKLPSINAMIIKA